MSGAIEDDVFEELYGKSCVEEGEFFLKKWANPGLFLIYFRSFQTNKNFEQTSLQFLQQINVKKCHSIQYSAPGFEHESSPMTTRPGQWCTFLTIYLKY